MTNQITTRAFAVTEALAERLDLTPGACGGARWAGYCPCDCWYPQFTLSVGPTGPEVWCACDESGVDHAVRMVRDDRQAIENFYDRFGRVPDGLTPSVGSGGISVAPFSDPEPATAESSPRSAVALASKSPRPPQLRIFRP
jgi:hypothetical protein